MSYILDALRKSEQQRQASKPDTVTDRILVNAPPPKQKSAKWIAALVIVNLLVVAYFVWLFSQKPPVSSQQKAVVSQAKPNLPPLAAPAAQASIKPKPVQLPAMPPETETATTSIAQLVEAKKMADLQRTTKPVPEKKPLPVKKELPPKAATPATTQAEPDETMPESPAIAAPNQGTLDVNELPYGIRNNLPNLTINVFSYADQPDDRFVIIDMVKYRTGQLIKGSVKLKEIRPDSIVVQYGSDTFRVERP
jgi:general secretion pathway protein B